MSVINFYEEVPTLDIQINYLLHPRSIKVMAYVGHTYKQSIISTTAYNNWTKELQIPTSEPETSWIYPHELVRVGQPKLLITNKLKVQARFGLTMREITLYVAPQLINRELHLGTEFLINFNIFTIAPHRLIEIDQIPNCDLHQHPHVHIVIGEQSVIGHLDVGQSSSFISRSLLEKLLPYPKSFPFYSWPAVTWSGHQYRIPNCQISIQYHGITKPIRVYLIDDSNKIILGYNFVKAFRLLLLEFTFNNSPPLRSITPINLL